MNPKLEWPYPTNGFFKNAQPALPSILGYMIYPGWWSRMHEYTFAYVHTKGNIVMDMGSGAEYRPFKDIVSMHASEVYAIDRNPEILNTPHNANVIHVVSDFLSLNEHFPKETADTITCISVLEDLTGQIAETLEVFKWLLRPTGRIVLTFDTPYNIDKPCEHYPGMSMDEFYTAVDKAGLYMETPFDEDRNDLLYHAEFNLTVAHAVLLPKE